MYFGVLLGLTLFEELGIGIQGLMGVCELRFVLQVS